MTTPRMVAPLRSNKYYYSNFNPFYRCGLGMPNCTAYAWGRFAEVLGRSHDLSLSNACDWYGHKDSFIRRKTPVIGAVVCWRGGWGNYGHVAVVEHVDNDGMITVSQSAYGGRTWYITRHKPPYHFGRYKFQGFIYPPIRDIDRSYSITVKEGLNIRKSASTRSTKLGSLAYGTVIRATIWKGNWLYIPKYKGWVCWRENDVEYVRMIKKII